MLGIGHPAVRHQVRPQILESELEILGLNYGVSDMDVLYAALSNDLDSLNSPNAVSIDYFLEGLSQGIPEKGIEAKWRKAEPPFTIIYESGSWILLLGEECLPKHMSKLDFSLQGA